MDNNEEISDAKSIANAFNSNFSNIGKELDNQIPRVECNLVDYLQSPVKSSFFFFLTASYRELEVELSNLRTGKAAGPFSIPIDNFHFIFSKYRLLCKKLIVYPHTSGSAIKSLSTGHLGDSPLQKNKENQ